MDKELKGDVLVNYYVSKDWDEHEGNVVTYEVRGVWVLGESLIDLYHENSTFADAIDERIRYEEELINN